MLSATNGPLTGGGRPEAAGSSALWFSPRPSSGGRFASEVLAVERCWGALEAATFSSGESSAGVVHAPASTVGPPDGSPLDPVWAPAGAGGLAPACDPPHEPTAGARRAGSGRHLRGAASSNPDWYGDGRTRVLLAVVGGATRMEQLIEATGFARSTVHDHLRRLRAEGLVTWDRGKNGTIRPLVAVVR